VPGAPFELRRGRCLKGRPNRRRVGDQGEALALRYLSEKGYALVERNYRTRYGEIDLVVRDGKTLAFTEVEDVLLLVPPLSPSIGHLGGPQKGLRGA
jgi:hypothetical protein